MFFLCFWGQNWIRVIFWNQSFLQEKTFEDVEIVKSVVVYGRPKLKISSEKGAPKNFRKRPFWANFGTRNSTILRSIGSIHWTIFEIIRSSRPLYTSVFRIIWYLFPLNRFRFELTWVFEKIICFSDIGIRLNFQNRPQLYPLTFLVKSVAKNVKKEMNRNAVYWTIRDQTRKVTDLKGGWVK